MDGEAMLLAIRQALVSLGGHAGDFLIGAALDGELRFIVEWRVKREYGEQLVARDIAILKGARGAQGHSGEGTHVVVSRDGVGDPVGAIAQRVAEERR